MKSSRLIFIFSFLLSIVNGYAQNSSTQLRRLTASDGSFGDDLGTSVAIDGNFSLIGAPDDGDNGIGSGSAYLFNIITGNQVTKFTADDGAIQDAFGWSVAIDGNFALIGAPDDDDNANGSGSAYLFDLTTGNQLFKFTADVAMAGAAFGSSVALNGNLAIIGAPIELNSQFNTGSAYIFDITTGNQITKLAPQGGGQFGASVALDGNIALVGARFDNELGIRSGSAYLFDVTTGQQIHKLLAEDGAAGDLFGVSVAISGNIALIGSSDDDDNGDFSGAAYTFNVATGEQLVKLIPTDGAERDIFGTSVSIDTGIAIIGARGDDDNGSSSGSAYFFNALNGEQIAKIYPNDGESDDFFGEAVSIDGSRAIIGARGDDFNGVFSGSAYVFEAPLLPDVVNLPQLDIHTDNDNFILTWKNLDPLEAKLMYTTDLRNPDSWLEVDALITVQEGISTVTVGEAESSIFYRLSYGQ